MTETYPLELSGREMRALVDRAMDRIADHIDSLATRPASYQVGGGAALARSLVERLPKQGTNVDQLLDVLFERIVPVSFNTPGPGYLAYIPGGGVLESAVADLISNSINRYIGVWVAAPGLVQLEANVVRWFGEIVGYPEDAGGLLTTGGSLANMIALVTARRVRLPDDFLDGIIYASDQTHHSVQKSALLAGFPEGNIREVPSDEGFRIRVPELRRLIASDREAGLTPFLVVGNAGTTNTGAVDDLQRLADLAEEERLWFHIDAAYGGFFALTERGRRVMEGLHRADSITLDPHKGLFLPYGNGSLLVRDPDTLRRAHSTFADYMPVMQDDYDFVDFTQVSPELSRDYRGLRAWLPIKVHGIDVFTRQLDEKLDLAVWAAEELRSIPDVEVLADPQLSLVTFRLERPGMSREQLNDVNRAFLHRINGKQRVYLTGTVLAGRFTLRICILSFRTHADRMRMCVEDVRAAAGEV